MVEKGKSPQMTGFLLTDAADPKGRKSIRKVALWQNTNLANLNAPVLRGVIQTEKGKYCIVLWWVKEKETDTPPPNYTKFWTIRAEAQKAVKNIIKSNNSIFK